MKRLFCCLLSIVLMLGLVCSPTAIAKDYDFDMSDEADCSLTVTYENLDGSAYEWANRTCHNAYYYQDDEKGKTVATISFDSTVYLFDGWYENGTLVSKDIDFEFDLNDINVDKLSAKLITRNILVGGSSFEGLENGANMRVDPANTGKDAYDDKWGIYNPFNDSANGITAGYELKDWNFGVTAASGTQTNEYLDSYWYDEDNKTQRAYKEHKISAYSGDSMLALALPSRTAIRKIEGLKPNTSYTLKFKVYTPDKWDFVRNVVIANTTDIPTGVTKTTDENKIIYGYYTEDYISISESGTTTFAMNDESKIRNWSEISVQFITGYATGSKDTIDVFAHISLSSKNSSGNKCKIYLDDLTCTEDIIANAGNSIRSVTSNYPQALRYKFFMNNGNMEAYEGMQNKNIGLLVANTAQLGGEDLFVDKTYTYGDKEVTPQNKTVTESNKQTVEGNKNHTYFTAALYNIGYNKNNQTTNYDKYGSYYSVRPYATYINADGEEVIIYGDTIEASVFDVMYAIRDYWENENDLNTVNTILLNSEISEIKSSYIKWQKEKETIWHFGRTNDSTNYDEYAYSFAVVPDTQYINCNWPQHLTYSYDWILNHKDTNKIEYVIGLGDITDRNTDTEWENAKTQFNKLKVAGLKHSIVRGNHDGLAKYDEHITLDEYNLGNGNVEIGTSTATESLGTTATYGSFDGTMKNTYNKFEVSGIKYIMLTLDYYPSIEEVAWAKAIADNNPDYNIILSTHGYLKADLSLVSGVSSNVSDGKTTSQNPIYTYNNLVMQCSNIVFVLCGHEHTPGPVYKTETREDGSKVTQMLIDPQNWEYKNIPYGMLAMLYFKEDGKTVDLEYFSAIRDGEYYSDKYQFSFELDLVD